MCLINAAGLHLCPTLAAALWPMASQDMEQMHLQTNGVIGNDRICLHFIASPSQAGGPEGMGAYSS